VKWRSPTKFTSAVSRSEKGVPGEPAQLKSASILSGMCVTAASIESLSSRSICVYCFTGTLTSLRPRA